MLYVFFGKRADSLRSADMRCTWNKSGHNIDVNSIVLNGV